MKNTFKPINVVFIGDWILGQANLNSLVDTSKKCIGSSQSTHYSLTQKINSDTELTFKIYGIGSGQTIKSQYYKQLASAVLIAYDRKNKESFDKIKNSLEGIKEYFSDTFKAIIVNNAYDDTNGKVTYQEMEEIEKECNAISYTVTDQSILGLENLFIDIAKNVLKIKVDEGPVRKKDIKQYKNQTYNKQPYILKTYNVVLVGDWSIGKGIIELFSKESKKCIDYDNSGKPSFINMKIDSKTNAKFWILDAGTRTGPGSYIQAFSESASAVCIIYDRNNYDSFDKIKKTLDEVNSYYSNIIKAIIVNNGFDDYNGKVTEEEMKEVVNKCNASLCKVASYNIEDLENLFIKIANSDPNEEEVDEPKKKDKNGCCCFH